ncbi:hypothetical protein, partial [Mycoplasmopsis arginini]|uniref:hypothetical protein n=1 Tax=Mycoplasmopsis arginini TaxID=2094 RepID=UPI00249E10E3
MSTQVDLFTNVEPTSVCPAIAKPFVSRSTFYQGDCLVEMNKIEDKSVDMILCDLPYGTTACKWDSVIDIDNLWMQYNRIIKDNGVMALFSSQPFTTSLISSNIKNYRYSWYWYKNTPTGLSFAKTQPMRVIEDVCIFYTGKCMFNKQLMPTKITD